VWYLKEGRDVRLVCSAVILFRGTNGGNMEKLLGI
jgi:hypothetical protein